MEKKLGKIKKVILGFGGYQDDMLGFGFDLGGDGWGVTEWFGTWSQDPGKNYNNWTKEDQIKILGEVFLKLRDFMNQAKVSDPIKLKGIPIEVTFYGNRLKSWRILEEVL